MSKSYGDAPRSRVWELLEAILHYIDDDIETPPDRIPNQFKYRWKESTTLEIETTLADLAILLYGTDWQRQPEKVKKNLPKQLSESLNHYLGEFLQICERHGGGQGVPDWCITLRLWGRDVETNRKGFEAAWREKAPPKSPSRGGRGTETVETPQVEDAPLIANQGLRAIPVWRGRDEILERLAGRLQEDGPSVLVVAGQGGIGKTSLAVKLIEAVRPRFERVLFFRCQEGTGFDDVMTFVLVEGFGEDIRQLTTPDRQMAAVMRCLAGRCLLVFDNLESILQAESHRAVSAEWGRLLNGLAYQEHGSRIAITSREVPADLGESRGRRWRFNPKLVQVERLEGVSDGDAVRILREYGFEDSEADLRWIAERVKGHPLILELLSEYAEMPGYLRQHPELVVDEATEVVRQQLRRQNQATLGMLARMSVLRVPIGVEGLTFLRCYQEGDLRFAIATILGEPAELTPEERRETQGLLDRLFHSSLVQRRYDAARGEFFYDLHRVIAEVVGQEFREQVPELMRRAYQFYCTGKTVENPKTLEDLRPVLEALYFGLQIENYEETENLYYSIEKYLERWGYWQTVVEICEDLLPHVSPSSRPYLLQRIGLRHRAWGNWDRAETFYQKALSIAEEAENRPLMANLWGQLGDIERNRGHWDEAERLYRQSLEMREELGDRAGMATSWGVLGDIERKRGHWDEAERLYRQSLEVREELGDRAGMAVSWGQLGDIERNRGHWDEAERLYRQCLAMEEELGDRAGMAATWASLGDIERKRGHWDEAERLYRQSLEMREELGDRAGMASSWGLLGDIERYRGHWDEAERLFRQSLEMREELGDRAGMAESWGVLGDIERKRGHWDEAERLYRQSLKMREELGDRAGMAATWASLGDIEGKRGHWDEAERLYRQCLKMREELGDRAGMAATWASLGYIEGKRGHWDEAERLYRQCLAMEEELGDRAGMAAVWGVLGDIERYRGHWDEAERLYRQSLEMREELGDRAGMAESWGVLGDIERYRGHWDEAERLFRQCLAMEEELGDRAGMATSWGCLGETELGRGNLEQAETLLLEALEKMQKLGMTWHIAETNFDLALLYRRQENPDPDRAQHHYTTAHQLYSQLGAAKDLERIEKEWQNWERE